MSIFLNAGLKVIRRWTANVEGQMEKSEEKLVMSTLFVASFSESFEGFEAAREAFLGIGR